MLCCKSASDSLSYNVRRKISLFTGPSMRVRGRPGWWKKLLSSEAKTTVRAIPVETATKARWSGMVANLQLNRFAN